MRGSISVPLPLNLTSKESELYEPYKSYQFPVQKIKLFNNVFITASGFCINRNGFTSVSFKLPDFQLII